MVRCAFCMIGRPYVWQKTTSATSTALLRILAYRVPAPAVSAWFLQAGTLPRAMGPLRPRPPRLAAPLPVGVFASAPLWTRKSRGLPVRVLPIHGLLAPVLHPPMWTRAMWTMAGRRLPVLPVAGSHLQAAHSVPCLRACPLSPSAVPLKSRTPPPSPPRRSTSPTPMRRPSLYPMGQRSLPRPSPPTPQSSPPPQPRPLPRVRKFPQRSLPRAPWVVRRRLQAGRRRWHRRIPSGPRPMRLQSKGPGGKRRGARKAPRTMVWPMGGPRPKRRRRAAGAMCYPWC